MRSPVQNDMFLSHLSGDEAQYLDAANFGDFLSHLSGDEGSLI